MLIVVDLLPFDCNKLVAYILKDHKLAPTLENVCNHLVIMSPKQYQKIISRQIKRLVVTDSHFELVVLARLRDDPTVMHELSPVLELRVHDHRHEVIIQHHLFKNDFFGHLVLSLGLTVLLGLCRCLSSLLFEGVEGVEETEVSVDHCEEGDGAFVLNLFEQVLVVLNGLLGQCIVHGR